MRRLSLLLVYLFVLGLFVGCGGKSNSNENTSVNIGQSSISVVTISKEDIKFLDDNGESKYIIVRPADTEVTSSASVVFLGLKNTLNVNVKNVLDENEDDVDTYEILIGNTNRTESQQALDILREKTGGHIEDYIICSIGKKICINAFSYDTLSTACTYFVNNLIKRDGIAGGIEYVYKSDKTYKDSTINGVSIGRFSAVRPHYNSSYLTQLELEKLQNKVATEYGYAFSILEDAYEKPGNYEIIVGNNNRDGVEKITNYDEYRITVKGDKVYINGGSPHATAVGVTEFIKLIDKGAVTDADSIVGSYSTTVSGYDRSTYYTHVWGDDFDGTEVDTTKWDVITEEHYGKGADGLSGQNGKQSLRVPEANIVENGYLYQLQYYDDKAYYGGTIRSNSHMKFLGGYLEHSVITPDNPSSWNTCWMSSVESNGIIGPEIDLNENFGNPNVTDANAHVWPDAGAAAYGWVHRSFDTIRANESKYKLPSSDGDNLNTGFHTFGFIWTEDYIGFTGDGKVYCDLDLNEDGFEDYKTAFTTVAVKVIIAASPGVGSGPKDTSTQEHWTREKSDYVTDYLHIYQMDDGWSRIDFDY